MRKRTCEMPRLHYAATAGLTQTYPGLDHHVDQSAALQRDGHLILESIDPSSARAHS